MSDKRINAVPYHDSTPENIEALHDSNSEKLQIDKGHMILKIYNL